MLILSLNNQGYQDLSIEMLDLNENAPSEGNRGTLEDLMKAAIADANKEKVVNENVSSTICNNS